MTIMKKSVALLLVLTLTACTLPVGVFSVNAADVYISISEEGKFIPDNQGQPLARRGVALDALTKIDLDHYDLGEYIYDSNRDGKQDITALHLFIYVHEEILGLDFHEVDLSNGAPGSMYFSSNLFGYEDENLRYDYNGAYPADENGWGLTADNIVLKSGDFLDVAHYSDWNFFNDSAYGFHYFTDSKDRITHEYTVPVNEELDISIQLVSGGMGVASTVTVEKGYPLYYGRSLRMAEGATATNEAGIATLTFPTVGTWYLWCDGGRGTDLCPDSVVSGPASAMVHVTGEVPPPKGNGQDVSAVLHATMAQLAASVPEPNFGTNGGEWTVLSLARGGYYPKEHRYFTDYYHRIVEKVNTTCAKINQNGALHKSKSTDNSRLIVALASIGKDPQTVGDWDLTGPYNDFSWIKKQGHNGVIWALIALDSNHYTTSDPTIRQQCLDYILDAELAEGGWALSGTKMDVDITGMTLQSLYPYRAQEKIAAAVERAFSRLSDCQLSNGGFLYGTVETSESASQVIVACTTWGINPDTDPRFVKNGNSVLDNLLSYYVEEDAMFAHQGTVSNHMATDQACYALVAYDRLQEGKPSLYDFSDVSFGNTTQSEEITASLGLPAEVNNGDTFRAIVSINKWNNEANYKLLDFVLTIPHGIRVIDVTPGARLTGGQVSWNLEASTGKLRAVYFDAGKNQNLTISGEEFPAELFSVSLMVDHTVVGSKCNIDLSGMSVKLHSDSFEEDSMIVVNTESAKGVIDVVQGVSFSAVCLFRGDDVDLIPSTHMGVAVAVTSIPKGSRLTFKEGDREIPFRYSKEVSHKTGVSTYIALVDAHIPMEAFVNTENYTIGEICENDILFGDINNDGVVNAQDALSTVDAWLRKGETPDYDQMILMNVNGDSRINTFDALGIVEAFVNGTEYGIVTKATTITTNQ